MKCFLFPLRVVSKLTRQPESLTESYENNKADLFEIVPIEIGVAALFEENTVLPEKKKNRERKRVKEKKRNLTFKPASV